MIYTGYFAQQRKYAEAGLVPVSIARFNRHFVGHEYKKLAPPAHIIKMSEWDYTPRYFQDVLNHLDQKVVEKELRTFGENVVLLCYEKPSDFCHRKLVAGWLQEAGIECEEFQVTKKPKQSLSLF